MKNIYCANLKLPVNDVMVDKNWLSKMPNKGHFPIPEKEVNPELLDFFERKGMYLKNADVFCSPPGFYLQIHIDGTDLGTNSCAINWQYCSEKGSYMQWWNPKPEFANKDIIEPESFSENSYKIETTPYAYAWTPEECDLVHTSEIGFPSLVNIGVPHSMKNDTKVNRYAISLTWRRYNGSTVEWDYVYEKLQSYVVA
jgi:hypothetical protein